MANAVLTKNKVSIKGSDIVGTGTAFDVAVRLGHVQVVELLLKQYNAVNGVA